MIRQLLGVTGQYASVDELLTATENLVLFGRLLGLSKPDSKARAERLLGQFGLEDAADKPLKQFSGGMRRRLDLAASLIIRPPVIFLDEPTTGLDPQARLEVWGAVRELAAGGTTVLLTTQYLDEADQLADQICVIDHGRIIAQGTPLELKNQSGATSLVVTVSRHDEVSRAAELVRGVVGDVHVDLDARRLTAPGAAVAELTRIAAVLDDGRIEVDDLGMQRPSLDDVFLSLTGHMPEETSSQEVPT